MTRRVRLWAAAVLIAAASGLMAAVAVTATTATTGVTHAPVHVYLAGIVFNAID
jgi:hexokinase